MPRCIEAGDQARERCSYTSGMIGWTDVSSPQAIGVEFLKEVGMLLPIVPNTKMGQNRILSRKNGNYHINPTVSPQ